MESIRAYIEPDSPQDAELTVRRIAAAVERLIAFPRSGRVARARNQSDVGEVIVKPSRVVYRLRPGIIEIVTVHHTSQQFLI